MVPKHQRRFHRLHEYDYTQPGAYFITIVTFNRLRMFGEIKNGVMKLNTRGNIILREWQRLPSRFPKIELDEYVIMPNHLHGIIIIRDHRRGTGDLDRSKFLGESPVPLLAVEFKWKRDNENPAIKKI